jgi:hypothetical protein
MEGGGEDEEIRLWIYGPRVTEAGIRGIHGILH